MKKFIPAIIAVIIVAALSFLGGMQYGKAQNANATQTPARTGFAGGAAGMRRGGAGGPNGAGGFTAGQVLSMDSKSITVSIPSGGSKIIFFSDATKVSKSVDGTVSDLKAGDQVVVTGSANSDGSIAATSIQLRPAGMATSTRP